MGLERCLQLSLSFTDLEELVFSSIPQYTTKFRCIKITEAGEENKMKRICLFAVPLEEDEDEDEETTDSERGSLERLAMKEDIVAETEKKKEESQEFHKLSLRLSDCVCTLHHHHILFTDAYGLVLLGQQIYCFFFFW